MEAPLDPISIIKEEESKEDNNAGSRDNFFVTGIPMDYDSDNPSQIEQH